MFDLFDFENTTPSRNFGSNARGGVLEYVDHCFGTLWVPYLSLIFLLRYIVSSPLFLVIYGSELKVRTTEKNNQKCLNIAARRGGECWSMMWKLWSLNSRR